MEIDLEILDMLMANAQQKQKDGVQDQDLN